MAAGCVLKSKFIANSAKAFSAYVDYINRSEAIRTSSWDKYNAFEEYNDYMSNPEKSLGLFSEKIDVLSSEEKAAAKNIFSSAQKNGAIMQQTVFSFTWEWLKETGIADDNSNINESLLRGYIRQSMATLVKKESLEGWFWTAAVHYNTKNIHVHIAATDPNPSWKEGVGRCRKNKKGQLYQRGKLKLSSLSAMKSRFINMALADAERNKQITDLIRNRIVLQKKSTQLLTSPNAIIRDEFNKFYTKLPKDDLRKLFYKETAMQPYLPDLKKLCDDFINIYCAADYRELVSVLDEVSEKYYRAYGDSKIYADKVQVDRFKNSKIDDMYYRLGNAILKECRELAKDERAALVSKNKTSNAANTHHSKYIINRAVSSISRTFKKDIESIKNQIIYEQTQMNHNNELV